MENIEKMLVAHLLEELFTLEVAKIGVYRYREEKENTLKELLELLIEFEIIPTHISEHDAISVLNLYFARQYDPVITPSVVDGEKKCNWICGCPSSEGPIGEIKNFHRDHIIPKCSSNVGAEERWFDAEDNSQQLCDIHNVRLKSDNIALGIISRDVIVV